MSNFLAWLTAALCAAALAATLAPSDGVPAQPAVVAVASAGAQAEMTIFVRKRMAGGISAAGFTFDVYAGPCYAQQALLQTQTAGPSGDMELSVAAGGTYAVRERPRPGFTNVTPVCQTVDPDRTTAAFENVRIGDVSCSGSTDSIDAALLLQFDAGLLGYLRCHETADMNLDGSFNAIDAALVLQITAGLLDCPQLGCGAG